MMQLTSILYVDCERGVNCECDVPKYKQQQSVPIGLCHCELLTADAGPCGIMALAVLADVTVVCCCLSV